MAGTMRKRGKDSWYLEVTIGTDFRGKPIRYNKTVHGTKKQAEKELAIFYADCEAGKINKSSTMKLEQLSPKTVRNYYSVLCGMMDFAIDMNIIEDTPCKNIRLPKKEQKEAPYYNMEEVDALLKALHTLPAGQLKFKVAIYIGLFGGLRKGEILGLNWEDVDFEAQEITICRTRMIGPKQGVYEDTPKTEKSHRIITLPVEIMNMLLALRAQQKEAKLRLGNKYEDCPAVLQGDFGKPLYPQVLQRWFTRFRQEHNLRNIGLHGLRHTHASMLAYMGTDKMQVSTRLGHSQLSTTLNIYTHLFEEADKTVADNLSKQFLMQQ